MPKFKGTRSYFFADLAQIYCPMLTPRYASRTLRRWITINPHLHQRILATGYSNMQRTLTPRQVQILIDELGEP